MVIYCGLMEAWSWLRYIVCCSCLDVVGCSSPLLDHCLEKARPIESKILLHAKGEKKC